MQDHPNLYSSSVRYSWSSSFPAFNSSLEPYSLGQYHTRDMEDQSLSSDIISTLPQDIIGNILYRMPIQGAVRTSVLSSKWKYHWMSIPVLQFDDRKFRVSSNSKMDKKSKFFNAIFHVLLFHRGPIEQFGLWISELNMTPEVDQIILYLSMNNTLKRFFIGNRLNNPYKVPSSLFSFQELDDLLLRSCVVKPPLTFNGLSGLRNLSLISVWITAKMLQRLLINCPQLKRLGLVECPQDFTEGNKFTFVDLFECLPKIVHLQIDNDYFEYFAAGGMPLELVTTIMYLEVIDLDVCFMVQDEIPALLYLIRSSPNLKKINILMVEIEDWLVQQTFINFPDLEDDSSYNLNYLKELRIGYFHNIPSEMEFVKLIKAKAPVLHKVQIALDSSVSSEEELEMTRDLIRHPIPHASPSAELIFQR